MRVTQNSSANLVLDNLQVIQQRQNQLQQYASTGIKVSAPGDDPTSAQQILHLKSQNAARDQYARNIATGTSILSMSDSAMSSIGNTLSRTKELTLAMSSATSTADSRKAAVYELQQLRSQIISLGNTQLNGKYIFGGYKNDAAPFDSTTGNFTGTEDEMEIEIDRGSSMAVNYSGGQLIAGSGGGTDIIKIYDDVILALDAGDTTAVRAQLSNIDNAMTQVLSARSVVGASINRLTAATSIAADMTLTTTKVLSDMQDVDYMEVISDLSKQQTAYQTAIAASAKISQVSLLDYLR